MSDSNYSASPDSGPVAPAVVFFDLDGTLVVGQTTFLSVRFLCKAGVVSRGFLMASIIWFLGYKAGLWKVSERSRNQGASIFAGLTEAEVDELMNRFTAEVLVPRLHPAATAALAEHVAEGDHIVVISAALEPVVKGLCGYLGVRDFVGTACEIVDGRYSGRLTGPSPHADEKVRVASTFMARWGADPLDCWAYADHGTDVALLQAVGHPVAVNPHRALRKAAKSAGWPIVP